MAARTLKYLLLDDLQGHPDNPKNHMGELIGASIDRFGYVEPQVLDERTGLLAAGHGRLDELRAKQADGQQVPDGIRVVKGRWFVPVVHGWSSADDREALAYLVASNQSTIAGGWDLPQLGSVLEDVVVTDSGLDGIGFDAASLDDMLADIRATQDGGSSPDVSEVPEPAEVGTLPSRCQSGDVWQLGPHRLMCGDATNPHSWQCVLPFHRRPDAIYADPPYGIHLQTDYTRLGHGGGKRYDAIIGDDQRFDPRPVMALVDDVPEQWWWGADNYHTRLPDGGSWIVWDKRGNDDGMDLDRLFGSVFELCWSRQPHRREIARVLWAMTHGQQRPEEDAARGLHPTQKPVTLALWVLNRWVSADALVADPYAGSGSTLIACELTDRTAALMEISPAYCDVILDRWERHTNQSAERVEAASRADATA